MEQNKSIEKLSQRVSDDKIINAIRLLENFEIGRAHV